MALALLIDDGVSSRGHRTNIFNEDFNYCGIGLADHKTYGLSCVIDYAGGVEGVSSDDHKGSAKATTDYKMPSSKPKTTKKSTCPFMEDYKTPEEGSIVELSDLPASIRSQIESMGLGDDIQVKYEDGTYKIETKCPIVQKTTKKVKSPVSKYETDMKSMQDQFGDMDFGGSSMMGFGSSEPSGYSKKSVKTATKTCNGKTTKTVTTTYSFPDGSSQTFTETTTTS